MDIDPEQGSADSGDLEVDLANLFVAVAEAAEERQSAIAILIDEIQYFSSKELGALIMALHKVQQLQLPLTLIGAGLPILPGLAGDSKSYAERLFGFPEVGALSEEDAARALTSLCQLSPLIINAIRLVSLIRLSGDPHLGSLDGTKWPFRLLKNVCAPA